MTWRFSRGAAARAGVFAVGVAALAAAAASGGGAASAAPAGREAHRDGRADEAGRRIERIVDAGIRGGGPFFTAEERAVIERACGYDAGSFDGFSANMRNRTFVCSNGRTVDTPEIRAVMAAAGPRIEERVRRTIGSAEFREAVDAVARDATAEAMRAVRESGVAERAAREAQAEVARASRHWSAVTQAELRRALAEAETVRAQALANVGVEVEAAMREMREDLRAADAEIERSLAEERRRERRR